MTTASSAAARARTYGIACAAAGAIAFSGKAIIVKLAYRHGIDAVTALAWRMLFSLPLFLALSWWASRGRQRLTASDWRLLLALGFSGYYLASLLDFLGLQYISASLERLILYLNPTLVALLGWMLFRRGISIRQWLALALSYLGVAVVLGPGGESAGDNVLLGGALVFASAASYALYLLYGAQAVQRLGALRVTGIATSIACVLCILHFLIFEPWSALRVAPEVLWLSALNASACTFLPVLLIMLALERIPPGLVAQTGMIGPLVVIGLGVWLLDEPLTVWMLAGSALVISGVWLLARRPASA